MVRRTASEASSTAKPRFTYRRPLFPATAALTGHIARLCKLSKATRLPSCTNPWRRSVIGFGGGLKTRLRERPHLLRVTGGALLIEGDRCVSRMG